MINRFPHAGDAHGATPGHPLLVPALSAARDLSMSPQQAMLDWEAIKRIPGLAGYWPADPAYIYQDRAGTIPASVGGVIGARLDISQRLEISANQVVNGDFSTDLGGWTSYGAASTSVWDAGTLRKDITTTTSGTYQDFNVQIGCVYTISCIAKRTAGNAVLQVWPGDFSAVLALAETNSTSFQKLSITIVATTPTLRVNCWLGGANPATAWFDDVTCTNVLGNHATQSAVNFKPILRQTSASKLYWLDSNTPGSALTATLGNLGTACTVAQIDATGPYFTENVTITSTYNLTAPYGYGGDIAIFNRALTASEKALVTRYMRRSYPEYDFPVRGAPDAWWLTVDTTDVSQTWTVAIEAGTTPNITVDWGDATVDTYTTTGDKTHTYATAGRWYPKITGSFASGGNIRFGENVADRARLKATAIVPTIPGLSNFQSTFHSCTGLTSLPTDLFRYNIACTSFNNVFRNCNKLQLRSDIFFPAGGESTRFLNQSIDFTSAMSIGTFTGIQGTAPALWDCSYGTGTPTTTTCFTGQTSASVTNYASIPTAWGGA